MDCLAASRSTSVSPLSISGFTSCSSIVFQSSDSQLTSSAIPPVSEYFNSARICDLVCLVREIAWRKLAMAASACWLCLIPALMARVSCLPLTLPNTASSPSWFDQMSVQRSANGTCTTGAGGGVTSIGSGRVSDCCRQPLIPDSNTNITSHHQLVVASVPPSIRRAVIMTIPDIQ